VPADAQLRRFEVEQQQRLRQFQDEQSRAAAQPSRDAAVERLRGDEARGLEARPRINTDRSIAGGR
jgi:hypothetical protein